MTLLETFTVIDWFAIAAGCALIILIPSLAIAWAVALPAAVFRFVTRRQDRVGASRAEPESEWADIERELNE